MWRLPWVLVAVMGVWFACCATVASQGKREGEMHTTRYGNEKAEFTAARASLVRHLAREAITDPAVLDAIGQVPRHEFVEPSTNVTQAYGDHPLPIGQKQTISQPYVVALM